MESFECGTTSLGPPGPSCVLKKTLVILGWGAAWPSVCPLMVAHVSQYQLVVIVLFKIMQMWPSIIVIRTIAIITSITIVIVACVSIGTIVTNNFSRNDNFVHTIYVVPQRQLRTHNLCGAATTTSHTQAASRSRKQQAAAGSSKPQQQAASRSSKQQAAAASRSSKQQAAAACRKPQQQAAVSRS